MTVHPLLEGVRDRLVYGDAHLSRLHDALVEHERSRPPHKPLRVTYDAESLTLTAAIDSAPLPNTLGLIAGDVVHAWRASLDNLVEAMLTRNEWQPTVRNQFPIEDTNNSQGRRNVTTATRGIGDADLAAINKLQPFTFGEDAEGHPLVALRELSNYDKHHVIVPTVHAYSMQIRPIKDGPWLSITHPRLAFQPGKQTEFNMWLKGVNGADVAQIEFAEPSPDGVLLRLTLENVTQPVPELVHGEIPVEHAFWTPNASANLTRLEQIRDLVWAVLAETDERWKLEDRSEGR